MIRKRYLISGSVQGVGFRPFVYNIATSLGLEGFVKNNNIGVEIQIQGDIKTLDIFEEKLKNDLPVLAKIINIEIKNIDILYTGQFEIIQSRNNKSEHSPFIKVTVLPDTAICSECKTDIKQHNKYYKYFATNCTNCGPRYSIIQTVPYDRINTSMKDFTLCKSCNSDYTNSSDRRYHAQPTSCNDCGPNITLFDTSNNAFINNNKLYQEIAKFITDGKIGAIKGIGGFHIVCDATNNEVVQRLRELKNRPTKPFAIMCKDINSVKNIANISKKEIEILNSKEAPIVILEKKENINISKYIAPNINKIGCILPYTALHYLLFEELDFPIVATSANISGEPIITTIEDIKEKLPFLDFVVDYNRDIVNASDDSVVQVINDDIQVLRLSRGYTPYEIELPKDISKSILAIGANSKNNITLAFDNKLIISPYIGDLSHIKTFDFFSSTIKTFENFYDFKANTIIHDIHPNYESTKWAKTQNKKLFKVQHHIAHIYSVKAQHNLSGNYTSFIFDGTGYGTDKTLWGGEVFINDKRKYSFKTIKLLGASKAIKEPKRVALSMLFDKYSLNEVLALDLPTIKAFSTSEIKLLHQAYTKNINSPSTSSVGRFFDAIASISGTCQVQSYEGEAGLYCEMLYDTNCNDSFFYSLDNNIIDIDFDFFDKQIVSKFINTLVQIILDISIKERLPVILSGGVFQNKTLLELCIKKLQKQNIKYYTNTIIPPNDSGISVGQMWYYLNKK